MNLARLARHRAPILLGTALLTMAGVYAMLTLPAGVYPEATFPRVAIVVNGGTFEPRDMIVAVTRPLEETLSGVIDLQRIRSRTVRGGSELSLDFRPGANMQFALQQVQEQIAALRPSLPGDLTIEAQRLTPSIFPMLQYEMTGGDPVLLRDLAQYLVRPRLARLPDVGAVEVQGGLVREVAVELDPVKLASRGISVPEVADRIAGANVMTAAGRVDRDYRQYGIIVSGAAGSPERVGAIIVRYQNGDYQRVRDLGTVGYGTEDRFQLTAGNGEPAALINVSRQPRGNILQVAGAVSAVIDSLRPLLPAGVRLESVYNQGDLVRTSIAAVRDAILLGGVLAVGVLFLFLGRLDLTLTAALILPLALAGAFLGLAALGDSLNLMSLGGLAVAIGLVIDDAVVVVENIARRAAEHPGEPGGAFVAVGEILAPVISSTLTTVVVFAPLALLEGVVGQFFRSFSLALASAVLLSLLYAVTVIPLLASGRAASGKAGHGLSLDWLRRRYDRAVDLALTRRTLALVAAAGLVLLAFVAWRFVGTGFLPQMDEGGFILDYWTPTGTSLPETDRELRQVEAILHSDPAVQSFTRRTGVELGLFATAPNQGDMTILLKPPGARDASVFQVIDRLRDRINARIPSLRVEFHQIIEDLLGDLTGAPEPVELKLFAADVTVATGAAAAVAGKLDSVSGLVDVFAGDPGPLPVIRLALDQSHLARLGLSAEDAGRQARASLFGAPAGALREPDRLVPIRVRLADSVRFAKDVLSRVPLVGPGGWAPLAALGATQDSSEASELVRENLRSVVIVTGAVDPQVSSLGAVMSEIRSRLRAVPLPPGVSLEYGGQYQGQQRAFRQLLLVLALGAGAVLLVMVGHFESFRGPILILLAASLGASGAIGALALFGIPFNVSSFMGLILLVGLVVKNGIILLDAAQAFYRKGQSEVEALRAAGRLRLRPILMTTLCTVAGLLPLAFGIGAGAELQRPLAIAVLGGLILSTLVTLVLLPVGLAASGALRGGAPAAG